MIPSARVGLLCGICVAAVVQLPLAPASGSVSPSNELKAVIAAADSQHSVSVASVAASGSTRITQTGTVGPSSGTQRIDYSVGGHSHVVTVLLASDVVYVNGDATVLTAYMGLKSSQAQKIAGKWFKILSNVPDYQAVAAGLTITSTMSEINMRGSITSLANRKLSGASVIALAGRTVASDLAPSVQETLYASARGRPLPIEVTQTQSGHTDTIAFTSWNTAVHVTVPASALLFSSTWLQ